MLQGMTTPERRRAPRLGCVLPVQVYAQDDPKIIETLTKDLSSGGLRCLSPSPKGVASRVSLELTLGRGQRPLSLRARIVWFERLDEGHQFYLGLAFENLPEEQTRRLSGYIEQLACKAIPPSSENPPSK